MTGDRLLNTVGSVFMNGQAIAAGNQQDHAARVAHQDRRPWMSNVRVQLFHRTGVRLMLGYDQFEFSLQLDKPIRDCRLRLQPNHAAVDERRFEAMAIDDAITGEAKARINAENTHDVYIGLARHPTLG
jgi:hypothetical protein